MTIETAASTGTEVVATVAETGQKTPGSVWVALILGIVGLVKTLFPESDYPMVVGVILVGNFLAGVLELYGPSLRQAWREWRASLKHMPPPGTQAESIFDGIYDDSPAPRGMTHAQAMKKLLFGG